MIRDALLWNKRPEDARAVLEPKVDGVLWLDELTADDPLDFFVLFSSIAGLAGNVGQSDYAYANAFLDAFARQRQTLVRQGKRAGKTVSINWPLWDAGGMKPVDSAQVQSRRLLPLDVATGLRIFETALVAGEPQIAGVVFSDSSEKESENKSKQESPVARQAVSSAETTAFLKGRFSELTKIPVGRIRAHEPLEKYGIDSILVVTFTQHLERDFGPLSKTLLFEYQTLEALSQYFVEQHQQRLQELLDRGQTFPSRVSSAETIRSEVVDKPRRPESAPPKLSKDSEIAIVGLFGRFPMADNPAEFWENLVKGRDCIVEVPKDRWDYQRYFSSKPSEPGKTYNKWGGFLRDVDKFDPAFFRIPPREAEAMDPQERLFLETAWLTVEDAGYRRSALRHKPIGVFLGVMYGQYQLLGLEASAPDRLLPLSSSYGSIANRVSYFFDWTGPSMAIDSMCSSSLTAIHLACDSIRKGESEAALAGGVNLLLHPLRDVGLAQGGFASGDGHCKSFGDGGDGYVPGEGVGAVLVKPLERAIADGDRIYAIIKSSRINHGGKTNGYTVPNPVAQAKVIADALLDADVDPRTITYLEAHGTGTALGDPIEITGLTNAFKAVLDERDPDSATRSTLPRNFCAIGSVKSNIGHLEAAAGIAGLIKILLQFQHRALVPSLHSEKLSANIPFSETPFAVQQTVATWIPPRLTVGEQEMTCPRRAGLSSFGAGGANAHLVLEEYVESRPLIDWSEHVPALVLLSGFDEERLRAVAGNLLAFISKFEPDGNDLTVAEVAYITQIGRESLPERMAILANSLADLGECLERFLAKDPATEVIRGNTKRDQKAALVLEGEEGKEFADGLIHRRQWLKLAQLWVVGVEIDWQRLWPPDCVRRVSLPGYAFSRERYWVPALEGSTGGLPVSMNRLHPLLHFNESTLRDQVYTSQFAPDENVVGDHSVGGRRILPAAASLELALAGACLALEDDKIRLTSVLWTQPVICDQSGAKVRLFLRPEKAGAVGFELVDLDKGSCMTGRAQPAQGFPEPRIDLPTIRHRCQQTLSPEEFYAAFASHGLKYGPSFQSIRQIQFDESEVYCELEVPSARWPDSYRLHPAILDGALQSLAVIGASNEQLQIPFAVDTLECIERLPHRCVAFGQLQENRGALRRYQLTLAGEDGRIIARLTGIRVRTVGFSETSTFPKSVEEARLLEPGDRKESGPDHPVSPELKHQRAVDYLVQKFAKLTKSPVAKIQADEPLENYGIDSVMVTTFSQILERDLGELSKTLLFEYPTLNALADYLLHDHSAALQAVIGTTELPTISEKSLEFLPRASEGRFLTVAGDAANDHVELSRAESSLVDQEIAIIGVFGRYPQASDLDEFWENLVNGKDCIEEVPPERWNYRDYYSPEAGKPGKTNNKWGGFIRDVDKFDPLFFNISPREAQVMDPQERLFLETVWKTVEDAGYSKSALNDRKIGVFVGAMYGHYQLFGIEERLKGNPISLSSSFATIANRISYYFNWHGPSLAIDTMCSSSLTSVHLACESLRRSECELAIAGGVNVTIHPEKDLLLTSGGFSALDGRCRTFGEGGTGYVPSEGVGAFLLKPLSRAVRDRDQIYAVIRVSALNHGGKTNGYTVPNSKS
ncbi:MAG TPA: beta-ketoacyl synthase N-terminal-like domain-containing protein, partial [Chthoniobacterales bacterium]|nr:beta-ketoacyl synthase N-terminal-like domain-containing protein [Chthoniobacterales bacterium]